MTKTDMYPQLSNFCVYGLILHYPKCKKMSSSAVIVLNTIACSCDNLHLVNKREYLNDSCLHDIVVMRTSERVLHTRVGGMNIFRYVTETLQCFKLAKVLSACLSDYLCIGTLHFYLI